MALIFLRKPARRSLLQTIINTRAFSSKINEDEDCPRRKVLIETDELQALLEKGTENVKIINATWYHKTNIEH